MSTTKKVLSLSLVLCLAGVGSVLAQEDTVWISTGNTGWDTSGNWSNGTPTYDGTTPENTRHAVLDDPTGMAMPNQNNLRSTGNLTFNMPGWTTTGDGRITVIGTLSASGVGTNTLMGINFGNPTIDLPAGNVLITNRATGGSSGGFTKQGEGTFVIGHGTGTHVGTATINAGSVLLAGQFHIDAINANFAVNSGALFGGVGTAVHRRGVHININSGATFSPGMLGGDTGSVVGAFTLDNRDVSSSGRDLRLNLNSGSTLAMDLLADGSSDQIVLTSNTGVVASDVQFNVAAAGVTLALSGYSGPNTYTLANFGTRSVYDGTPFNAVTLNGTPLTEGVDFSLNYAAATKLADDPATSLQLTVIPEPATLGLLVVGLLAAALRRAGVLHG